MWLRFIRRLRLAFWRAFQHGAFAIAKASAYSLIVTIFPAFLLTAAILEATGTTAKFIKEIQYAVGVILPPESAQSLLSYFQTKQHYPSRIIFSASSIIILASSGVMISWMEGFRNAYGFPRQLWGFWRERGMALLLVFLALAPMAFATFLIAFGGQIETWMISRTLTELGWAVVLLWTGIRWAISLGTLLAVLTLIYHHGLPRTQPWHTVLPGAVLATCVWFIATTAFGWYVTKFATYDQVYGSLGAAIALLVYLYMVSIVVLVGAEYNALCFPRCVQHQKTGTSVTAPGQPADARVKVTR